MLVSEGTVVKTGSRVDVLTSSFDSLSPSLPLQTPSKAAKVVRLVWTWWYEGARIGLPVCLQRARVTGYEGT
jgi:hypothetical protein